MYARLWKFNLLPGKVDEFETMAKSVIPTWRQMPGFRGLLVLRSGPGDMLEATVISTWETAEDLRNSENAAFQQVLGRVLACCEPHPFMREERVLVNEFASAESADLTTKY